MIKRLTRSPRSALWQRPHQPTGGLSITPSGSTACITALAPDCCQYQGHPYYVETARFPHEKTAGETLSDDRQRLGQGKPMVVRQCRDSQRAHSIGRSRASVAGLNIS